MSAPAYTDIPEQGWVARLPAGWRPYVRLARLDRPIGIWLLLLPCWMGMALAAAGGAGVDWALAGWFALGALAMRGAGCVVNDMMDRDLDARVVRTAGRPLACGAVSRRGALALLAALLAIGLLVLVQLDLFTALIAVASLPLVGVYPLMKRVTWWPQAFLGLTFNCGALVGWSAAMGGAIDAASLLLYTGCFFWTLHYDTIYAHQDKEDDALAGVKSSARRLGDASRPWLHGFALAIAACWIAAGLAAGAGWPWIVGAVLATAVVLILGWRVDLDRPADCLHAFRAQRWAGLALVLGGLAAAWA